MLKEISGPYYIVCGYTDLRRGIDGLAGIVQQNFKLAGVLTDLQVSFSRILSLMYVREQYFCFADEDTTESRLYCGKVTVFCCFTSVLTMADFSGRETKQRQNRSQQSNTHG